MFPQAFLRIISSPGGTPITCMQHLCPILLEKGQPWKGCGFYWEVAAVRTGEDEEEPSQGFPCSTVPMGWWLPSKVLRCPLQGRGLVVLLSPSRPVTICVTVSPWGEICRLNTGEQGWGGLGGQPLRAQGLDGGGSSRTHKPHLNRVPLTWKSCLSPELGFSGQCRL